MRNTISFLATVTGLALVAGCSSGPEKKLGRGVTNFTEITRLGEIRRSMEQAAIWQGDAASYSTGFFHGFNRSIKRTAIGAYEIVTFPLPSFDPHMKPVEPVFPDSYRPHTFADQTYAHDSVLGFSGGDVAPMIPGSRFRIFDF